MRAAIYRRDPRLYFETGHILSAKLAFPPAIYVTRFEKIAAKIDNLAVFHVEKSEENDIEILDTLKDIKFYLSVFDFVRCSRVLLTSLNILHLL